MLIAAVTIAAIAASWLFIYLATPMFRAETLLRIERVGPKMIDIESVDGEAIQLGAADDYYNTQYALLASRRLAARVLGELSIQESQRFLAAGVTPAPQSESANVVIDRYLRQLAVRVLDGLSIQEPQRFLAADVALAPQSETADAVIDRYLRQLVVEPIAQSRLVKLSFSAANPDLAALIVNTHAGAFIRDGLDLRAEASSQAASFLGESLAGLRGKVETAQDALGEFRRSHDIVSLDDKADVVIDRLEDINRRLTAAQSERISREADLDLVRKRSYESLPAVIQSELIRSLKQELAPLEREYATMRPAVTSSYFGLPMLRARKEQAQRRIDLEIEHIVQGIESDYMAARQREAAVQVQLEREKKEALRLKDDSVRYAILKQDVDSALILYDSVRQRTEETTVLGGMPASNVSVVDEAHPRPRPSSPRRAQVLILGSLLGLFAGLGLALLLDLYGSRLRGERDVVRRLRLPALGAIPRFGVSLAAGDRPPQPIQELYRAVRNALMLWGGEAAPRTVLVCSARESEGSTTTALNLAIACAQLGSATLLIDANLRRPGCHASLRVDREPGLAELLMGNPPELHTIPIADRSLYFLASGAPVPNANDLLASPRMRETLAKLREQFEHIVIDGPPLTRWSDSRVLAVRSDAVALVVDARKTSCALVRSLVDELRASHASVAGVILNRKGSFRVARTRSATAGKGRE